MPVAHARCCGLDVHKKTVEKTVEKTVVACLVLTHEQRAARGPPVWDHDGGSLGAGGLAGTVPGEFQVTHVAMESTGVNRGLLAARLQLAGRRDPNARVGESAAYQGRPGTQDCCEGQRMAG